MTQKIRKYFSIEANVSKFIFSLVIISVFGLVFGQSVFAAFIRSTGTSLQYDYGYGYGGSGYGYGYGYGVGGDNTYGFEGTDGKATSISATGGATSFTVSFTTGYTAQNRIEYGLTSSLGSASSYSSATAGSQSVTISSLVCGTTYYYRVDSEDAGGVVWPSSNGTVATNSCTSSGFSSGGGGYTPWNVPASVPGCPIGFTCRPIVAPACPVGFTCTRIANYVGAVNSAVNSARFNRDLDTGLNGDDVLDLQVFLNGHGFAVAMLGFGSAGHETTTFGRLTQAALARFQKANGIKPSVGYFGPKTRAFIQGMGR